MSQSWEKVLQAGKRTDDGQTDMTEFIAPSSRVKEFKNTFPSGNTFSGDEVFYKFDDTPEWMGPGNVIEQDGPVQARNTIYQST